VLSTLLGRLALPSFSKALPKIGDTERAALESGTVEFEGCFFEGEVDFARLSAIPVPRPSDQELAFLDRRVP
jgi:acyl-CoA dehydrogenase